MKRLVLSACGPLLFAGWAAGQVSTVVARDGDALPGGAFLLAPEPVAVEDDGSWIVKVDHVDPTLKFVEAVVRDGQTLLQTCQTLANPAGASVQSFLQLAWGGNGRVFNVGRFTIGSYAGGSAGLFLGSDPLVLEGETAGPPFTAGETIRGLGSLAANKNGVVLVSASAKPALGNSVRGLLRLQVDGGGNLVERDFLTYVGAPAPDGDGVVDLVRGAYGVGDGGALLYGLRVDGEERVYLDDAVVFRELDQIAFGYGLWDSFDDAALSGAGKVVVRGRSTSGETVVATQDAVLAATFAGSVPFVPEVSFIGGLAMAGTGDGLFIAVLVSPVFQQIVLFFGRDMVVDTASTTLAGLPAPLSGFPLASIDGFTVSPDGRYLLYGGSLIEGTRFAARTDLGSVSELPSCTPNAGELVRSTGFALPGDTLALEMDRGQDFGALPYLLVSDATIAGYPACGQMLPFGELIVDVGPTNPFLTVPASGVWGLVPVAVNLPVAPNPLLIGQTVFAQGVFLHFSNPERVRLTNAIQIVIGEQ